RPLLHNIRGVLTTALTTIFYHAVFKMLIVGSDIINIKKTGALKPKVNKSSLHPRQNTDHSALVDIAYQAFFHRSFLVKLYQVAMLN
ncbi:MAG: hypothetical protein OES39_10205, partial [Desulfobulbaceae bacterium]|nr:hypothetical protein [Desulfobulbaceae bacterium]